MAKFYYPNLDLFVYSLREGLGYSQTNIEENHRLFWQLLPKSLQDLQAKAFTNEETARTTAYLELLLLGGYQSNAYTFCPEETTELRFFRGSYTPVRLSDAYSLLVNCSLCKQEPQETDEFLPEREASSVVSSLQELKHYHEKSVKLDFLNPCPDGTEDHCKTPSPYLGKTWLISACIDFQADRDSIIQEIYEVFGLENWDATTQVWGEFLGAQSCEIYEPPPQWKSLDQTVHILVLLFPNVRQFCQFYQSYPTWIKLFHYHNKINWAYWQTRELKRRMMVRYGESFEIAKTLRDLTLLELEKKLQKTTETLSDYVDNISYFGIQPHTIATNLTNYEDCLQELQQNSETDLEFLAQFASIVKKKYLPQIESDRQTLHQGLRVLENLLQSIRGKIQIEQTKSQQEQIQSDRQLNETIQVFGTGLAAASIAAAVLSTQVQQPQTNQDKWHWGGALSVSLLIGFLIGAIASLIVKSKRKK
ncbi:hypothetical protein [Roseofilum capinflatum]|uniref:Uncharacterized protein n=1 Tax=Roseofilum capinflatum BLCC-M114 TaxID=3022440 RepID=A0ABT7B7S9_9CYAN|nr:hypothetical protein [Roseofilum capinflatum]MDJ1175210.1 hypothetical protein [Roseofilum capinflatum BLCC-M114]